jgi:3,4-dihydroxy 2-butanone 4-phosphate synthase/GTP cyclohydrolase II
MNATKNALELTTARHNTDRNSTSPTVEDVAVANLPSKWGSFKVAGYRSLYGNEEFVILYLGSIHLEVPMLVRIHSQCLTGDVFGSLKCDCGSQLQRAMEMIGREGRGLLLYQMQEGRGIGILNKIRAYALQDQGADTVEANERLNFAADLRQYHQCAEILINMGLRRMRLMTNNPRKVEAMEEAGLMVVERVALEVEASEAAKFYLHTKKVRLGHLLDTID